MGRYYKKKGGWGGWRPGAGGKKTGRARTKYSVLITPQQAELLELWGGGDLSAGLRWLIDAASPLITKKLYKHD